MIRIDILSAIPELFNGFFDHSIIKRAIKNNLAEIIVHDIREYGKGNYRQIDDYPFGGEAGMVLMIEPIFNLITQLKSEREYDEIIYMTPDGDLFDQPVANMLSCKKNIIILCGHYKGVDHRIREHLITMEISIGNYVLSGGEIPAAVITDAIIRLLPGALGDEMSALNDSFQNNLLAPPLYTRPASFNGWEVPKVLLSGNPKLIEEWKEEQAVERTKRHRPSMLLDNNS